MGMPASPSSLGDRDALGSAPRRCAPENRPYNAGQVCEAAVFAPGAQGQQSVVAPETLADVTLPPSVAVECFPLTKQATAHEQGVKVCSLDVHRLDCTIFVEVVR